MEPTDKEKWKELREGPLGQQGFDTRLQRRILQAAAQSGHAVQTRPWYSSGAFRATAAALVMVVAVMGLFKWQVQSPGEQNLLGEGNPPVSSDVEVPLATAKNEETVQQKGFRSALLVGLRTDAKTAEAADTYGLSEYRTLLIAPAGEHSEQLDTYAEGEGILMPYGQEFWMIDQTVVPKKEKMVSILSAEPVSAETAGKEKGEVTTASDVIAMQPEAGAGTENGTGSDDIVGTEKKYSLSIEWQKALLEGLELEGERLMFVGNEYIAVEQQTELASTAQSIVLNWMKNADMLDSKRELNVQLMTEPHIAINKAIPDYPSAEGYMTFGNWTVKRAVGSWIGEEYVVNPAASVLEQITVNIDNLPQNVASYDTLTVSWEEIEQLQPQAQDAFTSFSGDVVVVKTDSWLYFYQQDDKGISSEPVLEVQLKDNESVVMMQWASAPLYMQRWKTEARALLGE